MVDFLFSIHPSFFFDSVSSTSLLVLSSHLVPESILMGASGALMLKRLIDRSAGQAAQSLAIASTSDGRIVIISVSQVVIRVVQRNAILPRVENVSASLAAVVATARAAHDVTELDAAALAVPHEEADDDEDEAAESEGQSDGERMARGKFSL